MVIIADADGLQQRIAQLMQQENGERVIAVAFIGKDALRYIPKPSGATVYCWDNVAGTHPDGIEDLLNADATVKFVSRLHMKVYWAERAGFLIGSANLSNNALGSSSTALFEAAYVSEDPTEIDIRALRRRLERNAREITPAVLNAYRKRYFAAAARRERVKSEQQPVLVPTFSEYVRASHRKRWVLAAWDGDTRYNKSDAAAANAVADQEGYRGDKSGIDLIRDGIETSGDVITVGDWVLSYEYRQNGSIGTLRWTYVHALSERKYPFALQLVFDTGRVPFRTDPSFKRALKQYIAAKGWRPDWDDIRLSEPQLKALMKLYDADIRRQKRNAR